MVHQAGRLHDHQVRAKMGSEVYAMARETDSEQGGAGSRGGHGDRRQSLSERDWKVWAKLCREGSCEDEVGWYKAQPWYVIPELRNPIAADVKRLPENPIGTITDRDVALVEAINLVLSAIERRDDKGPRALRAVYKAGWDVETQYKLRRAWSCSWRQVQQYASDCKVTVEEILLNEP